MDLESDELVRNLKASTELVTEVAMYRRKPLAGESTLPKLYSLAVRTPRGVTRTALSFVLKGPRNATFAVHGKDQLLLRRGVSDARGSTSGVPRASWRSTPPLRGRARTWGCSPGTGSDPVSTTTGTRRREKATVLNLI
jgi:hypothetical protein